MPSQGIECPSCGEANRQGLFRCWKCKAPLSPEKTTAASVTSPLPESPVAPGVQKDSEVCRACGEIVPKELARCPKCKLLVSAELDRVYRESLKDKPKG